MAMTQGPQSSFEVATPTSPLDGYDPRAAVIYSKVAGVLPGVATQTSPLGGYVPRAAVIVQSRHTNNST